MAVPLATFPSEAPAERGVVWVLEDSPLEAEMARRALAASYDVEVFADGTIVLERIARGGRPNAMVIDGQLPTLSGTEVVRFLRRTHDEMALPVLMLTIQTHRGDVVEGLAAGANDYLCKPYDVAELTARVGTLVRTSVLQRAQERRARQLELAAAVGALVTRAGDVPSLAVACCETIARTLGVQAASLWLSEGDELVLVAGHDAAGTAPGAHRAKHDSAGVVGRAASTRKHVHRHAVAQRAGDSWVPRGVVWASALTLCVRDQLVGVLTVGDARPLADDEVDALASVGDTMALGVDRLRVEAERVTLLEREQRARSDAEGANRTKDEFLALVSHELRTPLNAIAGWVHMLRSKRVEPPDVERALETIERNTNTQTRLVEELLDVSRIATGKLPLENARVDLYEPVNAALESVRLAAQAKRLELVPELDRDAGSVAGDTERLRQVVSNLLQNAIKFTPAGGRISVALRRDGEDAEIRVTDTGIGIEPDFLPYVFERFRQADTSAARTHGGLGLGLAIVRYLVEAHGGSVHATSEGRGKGTTFVVRLPRAQGAEAERSSRDSSAPVPERFAGVHVVVVEDDADSREFLAKLLSDRGARVTAAASVSEALERMLASPPDIIISDIGLPGRDGIDLVKHVRSLAPGSGGTTPAIALTAFARREDRDRVVAAGYDLHVAKPLDADELLRSVARLLREQR